MSSDQGDKPTPPAPGEPRRVTSTPPPVARTARRSPEQLITTPAADAFSTPSVPPASEPVPFSGNEPGIFGGANPPTSSSPQLPASPPEIMGITPAQDPENSEDEMTTGPIKRPTPLGVIHSILRSNLALLLLLLCTTLIGTWAIMETVTAESYAHVAINMRSNAIATPEEAEANQAEIRTILRNYPLRAAAKTVLAKRSPNLTPGFLENMLFSGSDAVTWPTANTLKLRVNTVRPAEDAPRLAAVAEAFIQVARTREVALRERQERIANLQLHLKELHLQQAQLEKDAASAPGPAPTTANAELASALEVRIRNTTDDIAREQRVLDIWLTAEGVDPAGVQIYDNRLLRRNLLLGLWLGLIAVIGIPILFNLARMRKARLEKKRARKQRPTAVS